MKGRFLISIRNDDVKDEILNQVQNDYNKKINPPRPPFFLGGISMKGYRFPIQALILKKVGRERYWINVCVLKLRCPIPRVLEIVVQNDDNYKIPSDPFASA